MGRFSGDYDDEWTEGRYAMWCRTIENAIKGRRGQDLLRDLRAALLAQPTRELIDGFILEPGTRQTCAIGELAVYRHVMAGSTRDEALSALERWTMDAERYDEGDLDTLEMGAALGMVNAMAIEVSYTNDDYTETPHERWQRMLHWTESRLGIPYDERTQVGT